MYKYSITVRFADVDMLAHTNNASYFTFMEEARMSYLKRLGYDPRDFQTRCPIILAEASCRYKSPSYLHEVLDIYVKISEFKRSSFVMEYEIKEQTTQRLVAIASTIQVTYDFKNKKVISVPEELRKNIEKLESTSS